MTAVSRYPGSRSFQDSDIDRLLFYGREHEKGALLHLVLAEDLVLVYAKSGTGKTSLLNAGVLKPLRDRQYFPVMLRLNGTNGMSAAAIRDQVEQAARASGVDVEGFDAAPKTLAQVFGSLTFWRDDVLLTPILIFDQFEELFTVTTPGHRDAFVEEFTTLARGKHHRHEEPEESPAVAGPAPKIILSVREDYLGELELLAAAVPRVMAHRFRLTALTRAQAQDAIVSPAASKDARIPGARFAFAPDAVNELLDFLCAQRETVRAVQRLEIEPFQLQILCQHLEDRVRERASESEDGTATVEVEDLGGRAGMEAILQGFYSKRMNEFEEQDRDAVRRLCERGLISETGKRLSLEEEEIERQYGVGRHLLIQLIEQRLLRADPRTGSTYYELSHDTLVVPILRDRDERDPDALVRFADAERISGKYSAAIELYERAVTLQPSNVLANVQWASMLTLLGRLDDAAGVLRNAIRIGIKHESVHQQFGRILVAKGDQKSAIEQFGEALRLNEPSAVTHADLAAAFRDNKQTENAVKSFERSIDLDPLNGDTRRSLALLFVGTMQFDRAVEVFRSAIAASPQSGYIFQDLSKELRSNNRADLAREVCIIASGLESQDGAFFRKLGNELSVLGDFDRALSVYAESDKLAPNDAWTYLGWSMALFSVGRSDEAGEKLRRATEIEPVRILSEVAELLIGTNPAQAASLYEQAVAADPNDITTLYNWGRALWMTGRVDEAEAAYQRVLAIDANQPNTLNGLGLIRQTQGNASEAEALFRRAIKYAPSSALCAQNLGNLLRDLPGRGEEAASAYRRAIELDATSAESYKGLALLEQARGLIADAEALYRQSMDAAPKEPHYPRLLGDLLRKARRWDDAEDAYRRSLTLDAKHAAAFNGMGLLEKERGHSAQAEMWFKRAIEVKPQEALYYRNVGDLLSEKKDRWPDAETFYKRALEIFPDYADALNGLGLLAEMRGQLADAEGLFRRAMQVSPQEPIYALNLGELLRKGTLRWDEAEAAYYKSLELTPGFPPSLNGLALLAYTRGNFVDAENFFRKAMEADPAEPLYPRNLGDLLREAGQRLDEAEGAYTRALEIDTQHVDAINGLGLLAKARQQFDDAERLFNTAVTLAPAAPLYVTNLADLLSATGRRDAAERLFRKFLDENPTSSDMYNSFAWRLRNDSDRLHEAWELAHKAVELDANPHCLHTLADISVTVVHPQWVNAVSTWLAACTAVFPAQFRADCISTLRKAIARGRTSELISVMRRPPADTVWGTWADALEALGDPGKAAALSPEARALYQELAG